MVAWRGGTAKGTPAGRDDAHTPVCDPEVPVGSSPAPATPIYALSTLSEDDAALVFAYHTSANDEQYTRL